MLPAPFLSGDVLLPQIRQFHGPPLALGFPVALFAGVGPVAPGHSQHLVVRPPADADDVVGAQRGIIGGQRIGIEQGGVGANLPQFGQHPLGGLPHGQFGLRVATDHGPLAHGASSHGCTARLGNAALHAKPHRATTRNLRFIGSSPLWMMTKQFDRSSSAKAAPNQTSVGAIRCARAIALHLGQSTVQ